MTRLLFRLFAVLVLVGAILSPTHAATPAGKRVALVVGNGAYTNAVPLTNPVNDAKAVAAKLRGLGFVVVEGYDLTQAKFQTTIREFAKEVRGSELGLVFYAGHGMQVNGVNYVIPTDAMFTDAASVDFEAVPVDLITRQMRADVGVQLVVLDACRDNPLSRSLARSLAGSSRSTSIGTGLAEVKLENAGKGTAIIFATSPGEVALDGDGTHSPFTKAFLKHVAAPNTDLQVVMSRVTGEVVAETKEQQRPWINASLTGEVFLNPNGPAAAAPVAQNVPIAVAPSTGDTTQRETALYNLARETGLIDDYKAYLETFPTGLFAANARAAIERLSKELPKPAAVAVLAPAAGGDSRNVAAAPMSLPITDTVKAMPADASTEKALGLDKAKRRELQLRLGVAGYPVKSPDGDLGGKTRDAIRSWQASLTLAPTGYLNQPQYEIMTMQTEAGLAKAIEADKAAQQAAAANRSAKRREVNNGGARNNGGGGGGFSGPRVEDVGRFVGGVVRGFMH